MAKISKRTVRVEDNNFDFSIYYSSKNGFYASIPDSLLTSFGSLFFEIEKFGAFKIFKSKYDTENFEFGIKAANEIQAVENAEKVIRFLVQAKTTRREVIIIFFRGKKEKYSRGKSNDQHTGLNIEFSLLYCSEVRVGNGEPAYYQFYTEKQGWNEDRIVEQKRGIWLKNEGPFIIIDDTTDSREQLEAIYIGLEILVTKLKEITKSTESITDFINSKNKLLINNF